jgi:GMP synthase (glutamine-hydrolysing)
VDPSPDAVAGAPSVSADLPSEQPSDLRAEPGADLTVTVVQHEDGVPLDRFAEWLAPARLRLVRAHRGDAVPTDPADVGDGLVVLGGNMHAYADDVAPWLVPTRTLLAAVAGSDVPALGICLGAQLLAVATGGRVDVGAAAGRESGVVDVRWREAAAGDALLGGLVEAPGAGTRFPTMHADAVVELPADAVPLGASALYPHQAFRVGSAWGVQFHPETSAGTFRRWADDEPAVDTGAVVEAYARHAAELERNGRALARAFVALVAQRAGELGAQRAGELVAQRAGELVAQRAGERAGERVGARSALAG